MNTASTTSENRIAASTKEMLFFQDLEGTCLFAFRKLWHMTHMTVENDVTRYGRWFFTCSEVVMNGTDWKTVWLDMIGTAWEIFTDQKKIQNWHLTKIWSRISPDSAIIRRFVLKSATTRALSVSCLLHLLLGWETFTWQKGGLENRIKFQQWGFNLIQPVNH